MSFSCPVVFCLELFACLPWRNNTEGEIESNPANTHHACSARCDFCFTSISLQLKDGIGAQDGDFTAGIFGRELPADAPTKYREDYLLAPSSISPDKKLALIYPKEVYEFPTQPESGTADNYLVTLDPFRILGALPVAYFENINHKGLSVNWAKDSSAAVIVNQGKWSPRCVIAFELKEDQNAAPPAIKSTQVATRKLTGFISRVYDRRSLIDNNISA